MKARLAELVAMLRGHGVAVSVAEAIDGAAAMSVAGVERSVLQDALAAALVKREADRPIFDQAFDRVFPARGADVSRSGAGRRRMKRGEPADSAGAGAAAGSGGAGGGPGGSAGRPSAEGRPQRPIPGATVHEAEESRRGARAIAERDRRKPGPGKERTQPVAADARAGADRDPPSGGQGEQDPGTTAEVRISGAARERALLDVPFRAMSPRDVEDAADLARTLSRRFRGRLGRRLRRASRGRLDFRRTLRASVPHGGVPLDRRFRARPPDRVALTALCDLSASTATATDFFLSLLAPAADHFSRVRLYGFVDRLVEIEFVDGQVRPGGPIDLMARSDFGRVLRDLGADADRAFTADTLLLVLGDARNNRNPPRADLLAAARQRVRRLFWLNPEPPERWNTGDSAIASYARHADAVVPCASLAELDRALDAICRRV